jgi:hypothetical protein
MHILSVYFDHKVDTSHVVYFTYRGIFSLDKFTFRHLWGRHLGTEYNMVTNGETEAMIRVWERKAEDVSI